MVGATPHSRIHMLSLIIFAVMAVFIVRLFYLQIIQHEKYANAALNEQVKSLAIPASRGEIYALDNEEPVKLVLNENVYTVFVDPVVVDEPDKLVEAVQKVAGGTASDNLRELVRAKPSRYEIVAKNISKKQAELLKKEELSGLGFQKTTRRVYPEGQLAAQVLGFVNAEEKGQYGVEGALNSRLQGVDGVRKSVTDVSNVPLTIGDQNTEVPAKNGENVVLSLDRNIQSYAEKALADGLKRSGATKGSVVVMDPQTGKVLSMANLPTYSPEKFTNVQDPEAFNNATITRPYEPGSVMKTFTVATALDKGVMTPASTFNNTDYITVEDRVISNATKGQLGEITIQHALNYSLNTGMVTLARRLGDGQSITLGARNMMYSYLHDKFHLGEPTGIELEGEAVGEIVPPTDPEGNAVRYSNMSFGQGMNLTMLQVASGFSAIVNGGEYYKPTIVAGKMTDDGAYVQNPDTKTSQRVISAQSSATARKMVHDARSAFYSGNDKPGYDIGGKTGTSQTLVNGSYNDAQTVGSYLGYGGDSKPRYVIMVQVSADGKNLGGSDDAMPIFTNISNWMIDYLQLQPKG